MLLLTLYNVNVTKLQVTVYQPLPLLILGTLGIIGGLLCLFLPETVDKLLPQSLQDGENFGKDQKFWEFPCIGQ